MKPQLLAHLGTRCPYCSTRHPNPSSPSGARSGRIVRRGFYFRRSDSRCIRRFRCLDCRRSFSTASFSPCFKQKKRFLNEKIRVLLASQVSQRRIARLLKINPKTVVRKFLFLGGHALISHERFLAEIGSSGKLVDDFQFDEMETFERSKCLPLSIPLVVERKSRKILSFGVASMPAKGPLARISFKKYGPRRDDRRACASQLFGELRSVIHPKATLLTDQNPKYPQWLRRHFPRVKHTAVKGRRGCVVGQGELKRGGFDPLFALNHSCAMIRANVNRLARRTWCTTKRADRLRLHLALYVQYHNQELTMDRA